MNLTMITGAAGLAAILVADLLNPALDPIATMASYFVHGRAGWLVVVGLLCWAVAAFAALPALREHRTGRALVGLFATGVAVAAVVPTQPVGSWDQPVSTATLVHGVAGWIAFVTLPVAASLVNRRWHGRPLARTRQGLAVASVVLLVLMMVGTAEVMDGPDHVGHVLGLVERLLLVVQLGWLVTATVVHRSVSGMLNSGVGNVGLACQERATRGVGA